MILRPARESDRDTIRRIVHKVHINPLNLDWRRFIVAEEESQIVGIGQIKPHGDDTRELASLAVIPSRQGQGIGTALVRALLQDSTPPLYLTCRTRLTSYYVRFGFVLLQPAEMPPYYRRLSRLVNLFAGGGRQRMAVMRWSGP